MATVTRTVASRKYDHVYDTTYAVSGAKDHYKAAQQVMFSQLERVPDTKNMFSEMGHYPAHSLRFNFKQEVPQHMDGAFHPPADRADAPPADLAGSITGTNRFKYFKRPIVPFMHAVPPSVLMDTGGAGGGAPEADAGGAPGETFAADAAEDAGIVSGGKRTVAVQSVFRDGEAQTDPYTPDYVVREGEEPAVLGLQTLTYGKGLPAGKAEVELIERQRAKKAFEAALPPITDEASFALRRKMMEEQELLEWNQREAEIDRIQNERLALLQRAIDARDREDEFIADQRVEEMRRALTEDKERAVAAIQRRRVTTLRKLTKDRTHAEPKPRKRDIIADYADHSSGVYAPVTRLGQHPDRNKHHEFEDATADLSNLQALTSLERTMPRKLTAAKTARPSKHTARSAAERLDATIAADLERVNDSLKAAREGEDARRAEEEEMMRRRKRVVRPPTPEVAPESDDEESGVADIDLAALLVQKLVRGRAVQNMMFEGKERRLELIRELREEEYQRAQAAALAEEDAREAMAEHVEAAQDALMDAAQGEVASATTDFMAKELVRTRQAGKVAALAAKASTQRFEREAEESGKRAHEEALRARQDVVYRQLQRVHMQTAESYVDALVGLAVETVASHQAASEASLRKGLIAPGMDAAEGEINDSGAVVRDLVASFLLPEVERQQVEGELALHERRFTDAAHKTITDAISTAERSAPSTAASSKGGKK